MKQYIGAFIGILAAAICGYFILQWSQGELAVGADAVTPIAGQTYTLAGSGISSTDTSFTLTSFTITQNGYKIQDSDMSDTFYITLEPGSRARQEIISCTTVVQNADNTATISGCVRGLSPVTPYSASSTLQFAHSGGSIAIFSNPPQLYKQAAFKDNDETITGAWLFPTPLGDFNAATKEYVDSVVTGGVVTNDRLSVAGSAGETVATGTLVYFNGTDQEWYKVNSNSTTTFEDRFIGLTQGAGTNGNAIARGVLLQGRDTTQTGLTVGATYYANSSGGISTATSSQPVGIAEDTNVLYFDPVLTNLVVANGNNVLTGSNTFTGGVSGVINVQVFTASSTWTKPEGAAVVEVIAIGGGGGGGAGGRAADASGGSGGAGGSYVTSKFRADTVSSTVTVTVGAGGPGGAAGTGAGAAGSTGSSSSFGNYLISPGGLGGLGGGAAASAGGAARYASLVAVSGITMATSTSAASASGVGSGNPASAGGDAPAGYGYAPTGGGGGAANSATGEGGGGNGGGLLGAVIRASGTSGGPSTNGGNGTSVPLANMIEGGTGGGGGGSNIDTGNGNAGGNGGLYGGGGGGGGSSEVNSSGAGGNGANGVVAVITYR